MVKFEFFAIFFVLLFLIFLFFGYSETVVKIFVDINVTQYFIIAIVSYTARAATYITCDGAQL